VAALGRRVPREWSATERFRFANLLALSVATTILAFLPIVLEHFPISSIAVWASSSVILMAFCVLFLAYVLREALAMSTVERDQLRRWMAAAWFGGLSGVALAQGISIATATEAVAAAVYVAGMLVLLTLAGLQFALHAFSSIAEREHSPEARHAADSGSSGGNDAA
jgi:hypothetical protein